MNTAALLIGLLSLGFATVVGVRARRRHRRHSLVTGTETTDVRAIADEGPVELTGTVRADETFTSPIREETCVLSAWEIEDTDGTDWHTRASGVSATPFVLDDGTGEVTVDVGDHVSGESEWTTNVQLGPVDLERSFASGVTVGDVTCSFDRFEPALRVPNGEEPPEHVAAFLRGEDDLSTGDALSEHLDWFEGHPTRRYFDETVAPGDEVYILGEATAKPDATYPLGPEDVVVGPPADGPFLLSTTSEAELVDHLDSYRSLYALAGAFAAAAVAGFVVGAGVV